MFVSWCPSSQEVGILFSEDGVLRGHSEGYRDSENKDLCVTTSRPILLDPSGSVSGNLGLSDYPRHP